jgi:hypothetical protein
MGLEEEEEEEEVVEVVVGLEAIIGEASSSESSSLSLPKMPPWDMVCGGGRLTVVICWVGAWGHESHNTIIIPKSKDSVRKGIARVLDTKDPHTRW